MPVFKVYTGTSWEEIGASPNTYVHPTTHPAIMITQDPYHRFATDDQINLWNNGGYTHPDTHPATMIVQDANHRFVTDAQMAQWNAATAYVHPATHDATMIVQDSSNRFVSDVQIAYWNAKAPNSLVTGVIHGLMSSEDKVKLDGIADGATNYVHPINHPATMIVQSSSNRFVSDVQISYWDAKASTDTATQLLDGLLSVVDKTKLDGLTNYTHPATHDATMIVQNSSNRFVTDTQIISWNAKADLTVATQTVDGLLSSVDKTKLDGLTNYTHPSTHPAAIIVQDSSNRFVTDAQINSWNAKASTEVVTDTANGLMSFDDKIKLDGFTNYTHPSTHVPSIIVQDSSNRFVTDTQIAYWNAKAENTVVTLTSNGLMTPEDKTKLDGIADGATAYVHPANHAPAIITQDSSNRFVTDTQITYWNAKSPSDVVTTTVNGLMLAADKVKLDELTNYTHPLTHVPSIIVQDSSNRFVTDTQIAYWNAKAGTDIATQSTDGLLSSADKTKLDGIADGATNYVHPVNHVPAIITQNSSNRFVTDAQIEYWNAKSESIAVTNTVIGLMTPEQKIKLDGIADGATAYVHPLTHVPSIIVQDSSNRFVTDTQIAYWNAKAPSDVVTTTVNGLMTAADKVKLDGIEDGATNYVHPVNHPATILTTDPTHRLVTDEQIIAWNAAIKPVATVLTANTTLSALSGKYLVDASAGPIVITLLTADASKGSEIFIKKIDSSSNTVSVVADTTLPDLIDGMPSQILDGQYQSILISSSTTSWYIM